VDLDDFPGLRTYRDANRDRLLERHVAKRNPATWWRTIDRIDCKRVGDSKLLIPDLRERIDPTLVPGPFQPLHSLYYVISDVWNLEVLGGLLLSDFADLCVRAYSVRMASGYMRVSAQYLRRFRVPHQDDISPAVQRQLTQAFRKQDVPAANRAAKAAYGLT
jgi:hypothetical protein